MTRPLRGGVRRLAGGARACDVGGCWQPWPCKTHGTRSVNQHQLLDVTQLVEREHYHTTIPAAERADLVCADCGYHVCACAPKAQAASGRVTSSSPDIGDCFVPEGQVRGQVPLQYYVGPVRCVQEYAGGACFRDTHGKLGQVYHCLNSFGNGLRLTGLLGSGLVNKDRFVAALGAAPAPAYGEPGWTGKVRCVAVADCDRGRAAPRYGTPGQVYEARSDGFNALRIPTLPVRNVALYRFAPVEDEQ